MSKGAARWLKDLARRTIARCTKSEPPVYPYPLRADGRVVAWGKLHPDGYVVVDRCPYCFGRKGRHRHQLHGIGKEPRESALRKADCSNGYRSYMVVVDGTLEA